MATTCPTSFNVDRLREQIRILYDRLAREPLGEFHFHRGLEYAVERLGYSRDELVGLAGGAADRFAGMGNPLRIGPIHAGETVVDHACGAGLDLLLAARRVGPTGRAIGIDMTPAMREQAAAAARASGLGAVVEIRAGLFEDLPIPDESVDVLLSNGVVNLAPDKPRVFREIARVLRPGGRLHLADVVVQRELAVEVRESPELWAACIGGALPEPELLELAASVGLGRAAIVERFDCFAGTAAGARVAADLHVHSINLFAERQP